MSTLRRYLRHPPPGTSGDTALIDATRPMDALRAFWLANNCQFLAEQNPLRALKQHVGIRDFYADSLTGITTAPEPRDIRWDLTQKEGACAVDLGLFYAWPLPSGRMPVATLRFTTQVEGGFALGWVFAVSPGTRGPLSSVAIASGATTSATWDDATATVALDGQLAPWTYLPTNGAGEADEAEGGDLRVFRAYLGAYVSSGVDVSGSRGNIVGITLSLEPPP
jgi:hypothetical protein